MRGWRCTLGAAQRRDAVKDRLWRDALVNVRRGGWRAAAEGVRLAAIGVDLHEGGHAASAVGVVLSRTRSDRVGVVGEGLVRSPPTRERLVEGVLLPRLWRERWLARRLHSRSSRVGGSYREAALMIHRPHLPY